MRSAQRFTAGALTALLGTAAACSAEDGPVEATRLSATEEATSTFEAAEMAPAAGPAIEYISAWENIESTVGDHIHSVDRTLRRVPNLTGRELGVLRQDVNAVQVAQAQRMGVRAGDSAERLAREGRLVRLADSTRYWIVRDLTFSAPYVTPDTEAMLAELGERFHAKLDSLGLPPFRMEITSVLRTAENQRSLQRRNPNAARGVSAHEFGTTVDIAYRRFAPPARGLEVAEVDAPGTLSIPAQILYDIQMVEMAANRGTELQAVLGRVILEMRREGKLQAIIERQQPVYHMTVGRSYPNAQRVPAE
jgi:hypothetical protein